MKGGWGYVSRDAETGTGLPLDCVLFYSQMENEVWINGVVYKYR